MNHDDDVLTNDIESFRGFGRGCTLAFTIYVMRVHLDAEKCQGHNRCYALAPELFDVDDYGQAVLIDEGDVPAELHNNARLAASNCPEYAITITENG
jgi:ferredoxin